MKRSFGWMIFGAALGALFVAERRRPLRHQKEPGPGRVARNLAIGLLAMLQAYVVPWMVPVL